MVVYMYVYGSCTFFTFSSSSLYIYVGHVWLHHLHDPYTLLIMSIELGGGEGGSRIRRWRRKRKCIDGLKLIIYIRYVCLCIEGAGKNLSLSILLSFTLVVSRLHYILGFKPNFLTSLLYRYNLYLLIH